MPMHRRTPEESARLRRIARVVRRAEMVFEDAAAALRWIQSANASLNGVSPLSLLDKEMGEGAVLDALGQIEHGVFS